MRDWPGFGSESHTPEQSQQQTESLCLMHTLLLPLMAPKYYYFYYYYYILLLPMSSVQGPSVRLAFQCD